MELLCRFGYGCDRGGRCFLWRVGIVRTKGVSGSIYRDDLVRGYGLGCLIIGVDWRSVSLPVTRRDGGKVRLLWDKQAAFHVAGNYSATVGGGADENSLSRGQSVPEPHAPYSSPNGMQVNMDSTHSLLHQILHSSWGLQLNSIFSREICRPTLYVESKIDISNSI